MKKLLIISFVLLMITVKAISQKEEKPVPSIVAGGELVLLANGAGAYTTILFPVSRAISVAGNISYDFFFKNYNNMKKANFSGGIRLGVPNDVYTQVTAGYSLVSSPPNYYYPPTNTKSTFGSTSFTLDAGIQLENNIELGGQLFYSNYKNGVGDYLLIKARIAYVFRLKKHK
ncbi:MAG: hypothetical protein ABI921_00265 [Panacibacter sp.]